MITLALFLIAGLYVMYRALKEFVLCKNDRAPVLGTVTTLVVGAAAFGLWYGTSWIITYNTDDHVAINKEKSLLRAIDTGTDSHGQRYFLGGGYSESGPVYTYLEELEDGGFYMASQETRNAIVYQQDVEDPYMLESDLVPKSRLWSIVSVPAMKEFYVPVGSVQEPEYRVDVER